MNLLKKTATILAGALVVTTMTLETANARPGGGAGNRNNDRVGIDFDFDFEEPGLRRGGANRGRTLTLYPRNQVFGGRNNDNVARLKRMIRNQYPRVGDRLDQMRIEAVTVNGRSISRRFSTSTVSLEIAQRYQDQGVLGQGRGRRLDSTTLLPRRGRQERGAWQLVFQGRTEVDSIQVQVVRRGNGGGQRPPRLGRSLGSQKVQNFNTDTDTYRAPGGRIQGDTITIVAKRGRVDIRRVEVTFANGRTRELHELTGRVVAGGNRSSMSQATLRNVRNIVSIKVRARALDVSFPEAKLEVFVK